MFRDAKAGFSPNETDLWIDKSELVDELLEMLERVFVSAAGALIDDPIVLSIPEP
ncbi:hypothetical protein ACMAY8_09760 [Rhodobacteraceae bacterium nBUS_22]